MKPHGCNLLFELYAEFFKIKLFALFFDMILKNLQGYQKILVSVKRVLIKFRPFQYTISLWICGRNIYSFRIYICII